MFHLFPVHNLLHFTGENASQHSKMFLTRNVQITKNNTVQIVVFTWKRRDHPSLSYNLFKVI